MNLKRMLRVSSLFAGVGVAGIFGTTIANAAPAMCTAQASAPGSQLAGPAVRLDHHQQQDEVGK
jgi:hypothetical protein